MVKTPLRRSPFEEAHSTIVAPDVGRICRTRSQAILVSRSLCFARLLAARPLSADKFARASNKKPLRIANFKNKEKAEWKQNQTDTEQYLYGTA